MAIETQGTTGVGSTQGGGIGVGAEMVSMFASSLPAMNTPEALGWSLVNYVLSDAVSMGTVNGDKIEIPCLVTVSIPPTPTVESEGDIVSEFCITVLGHQLTCIQYHVHSSSH